MNKTLIKTRLHISEFKFMEVFLEEKGFRHFDIYVSSESKLVILFTSRIEAILFKLKCIEDAYYEKPYYFEPDTEFEIELEKVCGSYSQFDEVNRRQG